MPGWLYALLGGGAALLVLGARIGAWWRGRSAAKEKAQLELDIQRTTVERDAAVGEATVAKAQTDVLTEHVEAQAAAGVVAEEIRDAASTADIAGDRIAAVDEWVRGHQDSANPVSGPSGTPGVRKR